MLVYSPLRRCCLQVPKMLGSLRHVWAPEAFLVSFKLETDEGLLIRKVRSYPIPCTLSRMLRSYGTSLYQSSCGAAGRHMGWSASSSAGPLHYLQGLFQHTQEKSA